MLTLPTSSTPATIDCSSGKLISSSLPCWKTNSLISHDTMRLLFQDFRSDKIGSLDRITLYSLFICLSFLFSILLFFSDSSKDRRSSLFLSQIFFFSSRFHSLDFAFQALNSFALQVPKVYWNRAIGPIEIWSMKPDKSINEFFPELIIVVHSLNRGR